MRRTIDIPDELLAEARSARPGSIRSVIIAGLEELVRKVRLQKLRKLAGKIHLNVDDRRSRARRRR